MYRPVYTITNLMLREVGNIDAAKAIIDASPLLPAWEKRFQDDALVRAVHHGTHLEGNELNIAEARRIIEGEQIAGRPRDVQEIINYRNVIDFIGKEQLEDSLPKELDEDLLKSLHRLTAENILEEDKTGVYRGSQVVVRNSYTGEVSFRPPPAVEIPYLTREFLNWLKDELKTHPIIKAGIVHFELVRIHPFVDGNGRVARAFTAALLYKEHYDTRRFFSLEEHYDRDAVSYYKALQSVTDSDLTPWLEYFVEGLAIEFMRVKQKVMKISRDLKFQHVIGGQVYLGNRQIKVIEYIQEHGFMQNSAFKAIFPDISDDTVLRELKDLVTKGIIKKRGRTKAARYVLA